MTVRIFKWTDASAPTLSGSAGSLVALLDACLVTGYGAQTAAGWTKPFTGTNSADFQQGTGSNGYYIEVNDNGPGAGTFKEARVRGYETMTAFNTGTNLFPTTAQATNGWFVRKSNTADTTMRPWVVAADQRTFYLFVQTGDTVGVYYSMMFGEYYSFKSSDPGRTMLIARSTENTSAAGDEAMANFASFIGTTGSNTAQARAIARSQTGAVGSIATNVAGLMADQFWRGGNMDFTNSGDNKIYAIPLRVVENSATLLGHIRGRLRGLWYWPHSTSAGADWDTFTGVATADLNGRTFMLLRGSPVAASNVVIETSNTWDTN